MNVANRPRLLIDEMTFCAWITQAEPHDAFEYHRGFLVVDLDAKISALAWDQRAELERVASKARDAARQKLICLVQRRLGAGEYSYIAVVRRRSEALASMTAMLIDEAA